MSSNKQSTAVLEFQVALPDELLLDVLEATARIHRVEDLRWSLSLMLISRAVRRSILPVLYETLALDIRGSGREDCVGWDGRKHAHVQMAFLAWLLNNPDAPPRLYIKHLVFRHYSSWRYAELIWSTGGAPATEDGLWTVDRLTLQFKPDAGRLYKAGLRATHAIHMKLTKKTVYDEPIHLMADAVAYCLPLGSNSDSDSDSYWDSGECNLGLIHTWAVHTQPKVTHKYAQQTLGLSEVNMAPLPPGVLAAVKNVQLGPQTVQLN